jgi:hypothetical protein
MPSGPVGLPRRHRPGLGHWKGSIVALATAEGDGADLAGLVLSGPLGVNEELRGTVTALEAAVDDGMGTTDMLAWLAPRLAR